MSSLSFGPIQFKQTGPVEKITLRKEYDLHLVTLSWEQRATFAFLNEGCAIASATALWFDSASDEIEERKQKQFLALEEKFGRVDALKLSRATNVDENFQDLKAFFEDKFVEFGRPIRLLLDISCLPKNYLCFLIGFGFTQDIFARVDCLYSGGEYDLLNSDNSFPDDAGLIHRALTSAGKWTSRQIPYLSAENSFPDSRDLVVLMGGEIGMALPLIAKIEPARLSLVFISETAPSKSGGMLDGEVKAYKFLLSEYEAEEVNITLGDALSLAEHLEAVCRNSKSDSVTLLVLGSKSHALAAAVVGLSALNVDVVCRVPTKYLSLDVKASGKLFFYEIEDRFEPMNYL